MTVKQLRQKLTALPDDTVVVVAGDLEGNDVADLQGFTVFPVIRHRHWHVELLDVVEALEREGVESALVLWPMR